MSGEAILRKAMTRKKMKSTFHDTQKYTEYHGNENH